MRGRYVSYWNVFLLKILLPDGPWQSVSLMVMLELTLVLCTVLYTVQGLKYAPTASIIGSESWLAVPLWPSVGLLWLECSLQLGRCLFGTFQVDWCHTDYLSDTEHIDLHHDLWKFERLDDPVGEIMTVSVNKYNVIIPRRNMMSWRHLTGCLFYLFSITSNHRQIGVNIVGLLNRF